MSGHSGKLYFRKQVAGLGEQRRAAESKLRDGGGALDGYGRDRGEKATRLSLARPQHQGVWACLRTDVQCLQSGCGAWVWLGDKFQISAL